MTIKHKEIKPPEVDLLGEVDLELKESILAAKELKKIEFNEQQKKIKAEKKLKQKHEDKKMKDLQDVNDQILRKEEFLYTMNQISVFLSWGRNHTTSILGDIPKDDMEEPDFAIESLCKSLKWVKKDLFKQAHVKHKSGDILDDKLKTIELRLPLYEEFFGSLTDKDFIFPGYKYNSYDLNLDCYQRIILTIEEILGFYGEVKIDKNIFTLTTKYEITLKDNAFSLESDLYRAVLDELSG
jgi:hypothetical protein|tara:strand:- start:780 stop:1499 length:720 start_codon:yes stop_codon:yes gene_type:complete